MGFAVPIRSADNVSFNKLPEEIAAMSEKAPWITYRPELKVLDCTIRDGGLVNAHQLSDEFVSAVYRACVDAGLDYMEIGYKNSKKVFPVDKFGPWRHCEEDDLRRVVGDHDPARTGLKLAAMADAGKSDWQTQLLPASDSVLDVIRVAFYAHQVSEAVDMIRHAAELGYETTANLMSVSVLSEEEIDTVLEAIAQTPASTMVIVDSFGHLYREQIDRLYKKYSAAMEGTGKAIGIHAHNNLQLAFANTIEAIILGCNRVDSTMFGFGRGAGNCHTELLLGFLRNPKFNLRPIVEVIQRHVMPLRRELDWGPSLPYNLTGQLNQHPRSAIEWCEGSQRDDYLAFYDKLVAEI
jgi:4-hydroxy 2-oxovalerate aldolase